MRILRLTLALITISAAVAPAWGEAKSRGGAKGVAAGVNGEAVVTAPGAGAMEQDASRVVVWLVPLDVAQPVRATEHPRYRLLQHNKRFEPGLLVVPVGSVVDFPNADPWFHNVFSLYRGKRFDLGLYQAGAQRSWGCIKPARRGP